MYITNKYVRKYCIPFEENVDKSLLRQQSFSNVLFFFAERRIASLTRFEIEKMAQEANSAVEFHVDSTLNDMETFDDFKYGRPKKMSTELSAMSGIQSLTTEQQSIK